MKSTHIINIRKIAVATLVAMALPLSLAAQGQKLMKFRALKPGLNAEAQARPERRTLLPHQWFRSASHTFPTLKPITLRARKAVVPLRAGSADNVQLVGDVLPLGNSSLQYGFYSLRPSASPVRPELLAADPNEMANGGSALIDGVYHFIFYDDTYYAEDGTIDIYHFRYDATTWQLIGTQPEVLTDNRMIATETAQDAAGTVFGEFYNADFSGMELGVADYQNNTRTRIGTLRNGYVALGCGLDGNLYGIADDGNLYRISKANASETLVGATGLTLKFNTEGGEEAFYYQGGEIDQKTGIFYWSATDANGNSGLYTVNLSTGRATKLANYSEPLMVTGLTVMPPEAEDGAPAIATNLTAYFNGPATSGTISFTAPTTTFSGEPLSGQLSYSVVIGGVKRATGTVDAGQTVNAQVADLPEGVANVEVSTTNSVGRSPLAKLTTYIGYDEPNAPTQVKLTIDDSKMASLTWQAPTGGVHSGYVDQAGLTYNVYRIRNGHQTLAAQDVQGTSFSEQLSGDNLANYNYAVRANNHGKVSADAVSNGQIIGSAYEVPYIETFSSPSSLDLYTIIDANNDASIGGYGTWTIEESTAAGDGSNTGSAAMYMFDNINDADDWLITPPLHLRAGTTYAFSLRAKTRSEDYPETFEVKMGTDRTAAAMTTQVLPSTTVGHRSWQSYENRTVTVPVDGNYYFGIHATSAKDLWKLYIDDVSVDVVPEAAAPDSVQQLKAVADATGQRSVNVSFTTPSQTVGGSALSSLSQILIKRDGNIIGTLDNPAIGQTMQFTDNESLGLDDGSHTYVVTPFNAQGQGRSRSADVYVGEDVPEAPQGVLSDRQNSILISWPAVTRGMRGGYVDPTDLHYNIYTVDLYGQYDSLATTTATSFPIIYNTDQGDQGVIYFGLSSRNRLGQSNTRSTDGLVVGAPYSLPFSESFGRGHASTFWWVDYTGQEGFTGITNSSVDADEGAVSFSATHSGDEADMCTGKISFRGAANPTLVFSHRSYPGYEMKLDVELQHADGRVETLKTIDYSALSGSIRWRQEQVQLPASVTSERYGFIKFHATAGEVGVPLIIDNVNVIDLRNNDLGISIDAPSKVSKGQKASITALVTNYGQQTAQSYTVRLKVGQQTLADTTITEPLALLATKQLTFDYQTSALQNEGEVQVEAQLDYADEVASNNTATATMQLTDNGLAAPTGLSAVGPHTVSLHWTEPVNVGVETTEDFESYDAWSVGNHWGGWTLVDQDHGYAANMVSSSGGGFPAGLQMAYTIFRPSDYFYESPAIDPHSGQQYAAVIYQVNDPQNPTGYVACDNWLISPTLSGQAQTISFVASEGASDYGSETFQVLYSTTGTDIADFTKVADFSVADTLWNEYEVALPDGARHFAIRQNTNANASYLFQLDDISYVSGTSPVSYNIYRDGVLIANVTGSSFTDDQPGRDGMHTYAVTAVYDDGSESSPATVEVTTDIAGIKADGRTVHEVYNVSGQKLGNHSVMPRGVYVIDGRKAVAGKK